eukprot:scaffold82549_cov35-Tisochrysis_lutea.AAC.5
MAAWLSHIGNIRTRMLRIIEKQLLCIVMPRAVRGEGGAVLREAQPEDEQSEHRSEHRGAQLIVNMVAVNGIQAVKAIKLPVSMWQNIIHVETRRSRPTLGSID